MTPFKIYITVEGGVVKDVYVNRVYSEEVIAQVFDLDDIDEEINFVKITNEEDSLVPVY